MANTINILFFAALADRLDSQNESFDLPTNVTTVKQLQNTLIQRQGNWLALEDSNIRCAVNQEIVKSEHPIKVGDEIAFFPPVTGG